MFLLFLKKIIGIFIVRAHLSFKIEIFHDLQPSSNLFFTLLPKLLEYILHYQIWIDK